MSSTTTSSTRAPLHGERSSAMGGDRCCRRRDARWGWLRARPCLHLLGGQAGVRGRRPLPRASTPDPTPTSAPAPTHSDPKKPSPNRSPAPTANAPASPPTRPPWPSTSPPSTAPPTPTSPCYPADLATPPEASNLNWRAGDPPTPNKVDVKLSPTGAVKILNKYGTVHVIADIVGYYQDHNHDDRYYTKTQIDDRLSAGVVIARGTMFANTTPNFGSTRVADGLILTVSKIGTGRHQLNLAGPALTGSTFPTVSVLPFEYSNAPRSCIYQTAGSSPGDFDINITCFDGSNVMVDTSFEFMIVN